MRKIKTVETETITVLKKLLSLLPWNFPMVPTNIFVPIVHCLNLITIREFQELILTFTRERIKKLIDIDQNHCKYNEDMKIFSKNKSKQIRKSNYFGFARSHYTSINSTSQPRRRVINNRWQQYILTWNNKKRNTSIVVKFKVIFFQSWH